MSKLVVVTGGSRGIGRAIVERFASEDFDVVACARNREGLRALQKDVESKFRNKVHIFDADLSVKEQVSRFARFVIDLKRPVDVLVNNAGVFVPGDLSTEPDGNIEQMIDSNLYSAYHLTRALVADMKNLRRGHIFNLCSIASLTAYPNGGSYAISKFALLGFSKCLREELKGHGIRVTAVMPGATYTESWQASSLPEDRFMPAEDIAELVYAAHKVSPRTVVEELLVRPQLGDIND